MIVISYFLLGAGMFWKVRVDVGTVQRPIAVFALI